MANISEYMLESRLKAILENHEQYMVHRPDYDKFNLLPEHQEGLSMNIHPKAIVPYGEKQ